jgi:uncharacterized caspase-like protein
MPNRRALVVGIDEYPGQPLHGCVNDAEAIAELLRKNHDGSPNFDVQLLTAPAAQITRGSLRAKIDQLFNHDSAEIALLYFAGHGTENNLGGYIVTPDASKYDEGINLTDILNQANQSKATERIIILDSCMSGAFGNLPAIASTTANLQEGVSVLTASRSGQVSMESGGRGVFTELVCGALDGGAADVLGDVTAAAIYTYVEQALGPWDQRPLFKAHLSKLAPLRKAQPLVPLADLRQLIEWFPLAHSEFPLDPTYEDQVPGFDTAHVAIFKKLQRCRDARLVEAVGAEYMYFAAINSTGCRLTPLGQRYWRLAKDNRL